MSPPPGAGAAPSPEPGTAPALAVRDLSHRFGRVTALDRVSFTVPRGAFTALLGVNGAGKSTLFALITRLYTSTSGTIEVAGHDARRQPRAALSRIGVVFQSRALDLDLSLRQNLHYHAALHGIVRRAAEARIAEVLALVDLADRPGVKAGALSGGQQRRAEIARALIHRPELLLLDEATAGLDVRSRAEVIALVRRLIRTEGVSTLWATHVFDEVAPEDRVVLLHRGQVLAEGRADTIAGAGAGAGAGEDLTARFLALTAQPRPQSPPEAAA